MNECYCMQIGLQISGCLSGPEIFPDWLHIWIRCWPCVHFWKLWNTWCPRFSFYINCAVILLLPQIMMTTFLLLFPFRILEMTDPCTLPRLLQLIWEITAAMQMAMINSIRLIFFKWTVGKIPSYQIMGQCKNQITRKVSTANPISLGSPSAWQAVVLQVVVSCKHGKENKISILFCCV